MVSLEKQRALQRAEKARENSEFWEAIIAINDTLVAAGLPALPPVHLRRAQGNLMRAGVISAGDLPDDALTEIANVDGSRLWTAEMGPVYLNETVFKPDGTFYICIKAHTANRGREPGIDTTAERWRNTVQYLAGDTAADGNGNPYLALQDNLNTPPANHPTQWVLIENTYFRAIRREETDESGNPTSVLDFVWGELVPFGAVRRDPEDGKYYTPISESGVALYEPNLPHLVPTEYKLADKQPDDQTGEVTYTPWSNFPVGTEFAVGDRVKHNSQNWICTEAHTKTAGNSPKATSTQWSKVG